MGEEEEEEEESSHTLSTGMLSARLRVCTLGKEGNTALGFSWAGTC